MTRRQLSSALCAWLLLLGAAGCGKGFHKVEGVVTLDGKPVSGATIRFFREDGSGTPATAVSGTDGSFRLTTFRTGDGATAGDYKVAVTGPSPEPAAGPVGGPGDPKSSMEAMKKFAEEQWKKKRVPKKAEIPANYGDPDKTPLRQRVPPDGQVVLDLRSAGS